MVSETRLLVSGQMSELDVSPDHRPCRWRNLAELHPNQSLVILSGPTSKSVSFRRLKSNEPRGPMYQVRQLSAGAAKAQKTTTLEQHSAPYRVPMKIHTAWKKHETLVVLEGEQIGLRSERYKRKDMRVECPIIQNLCDVVQPHLRLKASASKRKQVGKTHEQ